MVENSNEKKVPWVLWKGALAIEGGTAAAMAIVLSQLARGVNLAISERLKKINDYSFIHPFRPEWSVLCSPEDMIGRVGRICPYRSYSAITSPTVHTYAPRSI
jgi:hypothetical protein